MSTETDRLSAALADRYRIVREVGQGGMARVYVAEDIKHGREVAVKVLRPEVAAALGAERFLQEIRTTANLQHPHIVPLFDSGSADGFLYYVMPLIEDESLRERLDREKQLPVDDALTIASGLADALGYAHGRGVVHRDVKPENVLLDGGHALLTDFGVARAVSVAGADRLTRTGMSIGTPLYMSPEQVSGDAEIDGRSDLYALGCVLYEMLGGQPPFTGPTSEAVARQHLIGDPAPVTHLRTGVPAGVAAALTRALAKNPADRFDDAAGFTTALSAGRTTASRRASLTSGARLAIGAGAVAVALSVVWVGSRAADRPGPTGEIERIAVLPLDNQTGDSGQAFFAGGMTRELIGVLTEADVRVLGYRAVAPYAGSTLSAAEIARELGVDAIVTGSVVQAGEIVQVAAELTDPQTNENLWARTFSRPAPDVVTLQHEIAREIARGIEARLSPDQERALGRARPVNPRAYAQYLLAQEHLNARTPESIRRSLTHLNRSIDADSTFSSAWATLALANAMGFFYGVIPPDSARAGTERAAAHALALDPREGDALIARGLMRFLLDWDFDGADEDLRVGMAENPTTLAQAFYTYFPWGTAQPVEATRAVLRLLDQEPTTAQWQSDASWIRWSAGDTAAARTYALRAIELDSTFAEPSLVLAFIDADGGHHEAARRSVDRAVRLAPELPLNRALDGYALARAGDAAGARRVLEEMESRDALAQQALVYAALGDEDAMYELFERAIDAREADALWFLNAVPALYPLRRTPRYQALLERMGLPEEFR